MKYFNKNIYNVILLGIIFFLIFSAFAATSILSVTALRNVIYGEDSTYDISNPLIENLGYYSLLTIYIFFFLFNGFAPSILYLLTPKWSLLVSSIAYALFVASYIYPIPYVIYCMAVIIGSFAGLLWTAQGKILQQNSVLTSIDRNTGIYWCFYSQSLIWSNLFIYLYLGDTIEITNDERYVIYSVLTAISLLGTLLTLFLIPIQENTVENISEPQSLRDWCSKCKTYLLNSLKEYLKIWKLFSELNTWLLCLLFLFTGLIINLNTSLYGTCIGNVNAPGFSIRYISLSGVLIGVGELVGGILILINSRFKKTIPRHFIFLIAIFLLAVNNLIIYFNMPQYCNQSSPSPSIDLQRGSVFNPSKLSIALINALTFGLIDSLTHSLIYPISLVSFGKDKTAPIIALFKATQSIAIATAFFYNPYLIFHLQLGISLIVGVLSLFGFLTVEFRCKNHQRKEAYLNYIANASIEMNARNVNSN